ncbi:Uncharacterised protein [BD1-7 clade bacterium]|uniref:Uncharacterized protein n=1 Tax=BD1-7 clade bacterium TaxID=2029982 RepID=A0A5S9P1B9_9GAMM|nr:Uncharacterised protein [BD1-7 clade bacterium]CAA0116272.1 Uncharacterised protein [BD1-7 clade bacterium]CAA0119933.1 Uncharacterised protein [BD1-7 clade bacterium]
MDLFQIKEQLQRQIIEFEGVVAEDVYDLATKSRALSCLSDCYRRRAIALYLDDMDIPAYFSHLARSAQARVRLLLLPLAENDGYRCASILMPFFDALVCDNRDLAHQIILHSSSHWINGEEFEEDFYYAGFLFCLLSNRQDTSNLESLLFDFSQAADGAETQRVALCEALLNQDQPAFYSALADFIDEYERRYAMRVEMSPSTNDELETEPYLCIEGLALLKIARVCGIHITDEQPYMPTLALKGAVATPSVV